MILALILRVYQLDKVPPALFGDEVDVGYQAYSLLKTGQDLYGNSWPVLVHSLSEYRAPAFIYSDIPFIAIFGLNEWGVRLSSVFWGILGILGIYFLTRKLFSERIALFSALTLAISPWHIQYSRAAFEVTMLLAFLIWGTYFFLKSLEKTYYLILVVVLFSLTPYIYSTAVVFIPILTLILITIYRKSIKLKTVTTIVALLIAVIVLIPYGKEALFGRARDRFGIVSIFANKDLSDKVLLAQQTEKLSLDFQKVFHNKPVIWLQTFTLNYLRVFSPEFLFLMGDPQPRHSIHEIGQQYYFELPLLLLGIGFLLKSNLKHKKLILGWFLAAPIPAALTYDGGFHATRTFILLVPLVTLIGIGWDSIISNFKRTNFKYLTYLILIIGLFNFPFYLHRYFYHYPIESWRAWQTGFKEVMEYIKATDGDYNKVLINNTYEPSLIRFLFWTKYDPIKFHQNFKGDKPIKNITDNFDGFSLENKYYFGKISGPFENLLNDKTLYIASGRDDITNPSSIDNDNVRLMRIVYSPSSLPIFYILSGVKNEK